MSTTSAHATQCMFVGGTLDGKRQGRMLMNHVPSIIMEPIYKLVGKDNDCLYKNITTRQLYKLDAPAPVDGALRYRFDRMESGA